MLFRGRDKELETSVREAFAFISSSGAPKVVQSYYYEQSLGDALIELEGDGVRVRITRDRGQILVDLAPRGFGDWCIEDVVLQSIGVDSNARNEDRTVSQIAELIRSNFGQIAKAFEKANWKATETDLTARLERRGKESEALLFSPRGPKQ